MMCPSAIQPRIAGRIDRLSTDAWSYMTAQDLKPVIDVAGVRQQAADQVVPARRGAHRWEPWLRSRIQAVEAFEMDAQAGVELRLDQRGAHMEDDVRIGRGDTTDRLESVAGGVELAGDVMVRDPREQFVHLGLQRWIVGRFGGRLQPVLDGACL